MEPFYIFITALLLVAAKLYYDSKIRERKANLLYFEWQDRRREIGELSWKLLVIGSEIMNKNKINQCFENLQRYKKIQSDMQEILEKFKEYETQKYKEPNIYRNLEQRVQAAHKEFLNSIKFHVIVYYDPHSLPLLKLAAYILKEVGDLKLPLLELEIDPTTLIQTLDKLELNQKLQTKLPPKPKAKINKI